MTTGDFIHYYALRAIESLNLVVYVVGFCVAIWAFRRCSKWGYLVVALYFALLLAWPPISRAVNAHRAPDISAKTRQKIDAAVQEAIDKTLVEEGHPEGIPEKRTVHFPFGQILLVVGLWLVARRETHRPNTALEPTATTP